MVACGAYFSGDKIVRATELVKLLSLEKSVKGAIKLVTALKLPNLAERFNSILEVRLQFLNKCLEFFITDCVRLEATLFI